jgi:hypothetical protein
MDYVTASDTAVTAINFKPTLFVFGDRALVIDLAAKTITVGDQWDVSDAAQEVVRIMAEQFGWEKV